MNPHLFHGGGVGICYTTRCYILQRLGWHPHLFQEGGIGTPIHQYYWSTITMLYCPLCYKWWRRHPHLFCKPTATAIFWVQPSPWKRQPLWGDDSLIRHYQDVKLARPWGPCFGGVQFLDKNETRLGPEHIGCIYHRWLGLLARLAGLAFTQKATFQRHCFACDLAPHGSKWWADSTPRFPLISLGFP